MKHGALQIWKHFAVKLLAPWWHRLYPDGQFHVKPGSLPNVTAHLLLLHMAYPRVKARMEETAQIDDLQLRFQRYLSDLKFLFEFAIPTVHMFTLLTFSSQ